MITLLTDFGTSAPYTASMKGIILGIVPGAAIIDITHGIAAHNVDEAAYVLSRCYRDFPQGTIHVIVVDPGVGTGRPILAVLAGGYVFLAPDNGVLKYVLDAHTGYRAFRLSNQDLFLSKVSQTFHGRDIFAPVAAHLETGMPIETVGPPVTQLVTGIISRAEKRGESIFGELIYFDTFGNAISNISERLMAGRSITAIRCGDLCLKGLHRTYGEVRPGEPLALIGSMNTLELSVAGGCVKTEYQLAVGDRVEIKLRPV